jgi:hypothetical protein
MLSSLFQGIWMPCSQVVQAKDQAVSCLKKSGLNTQASQVVCVCVCVCVFVRVSVCLYVILCIADSVCHLRKDQIEYDADLMFIYIVITHSSNSILFPNTPGANISRGWRCLCRLMGTTICKWHINRFVCSWDDLSDLDCGMSCPGCRVEREAWKSAAAVLSRLHFGRTLIRAGPLA